MMKRHKFTLSDTGTFGDTGPGFHGVIMQLHWNPSTDTGATIEMSLLPKTGDTGDGWVFYSQADVLQSNFTRAPRQTLHDSVGLDTGVDSYGPIVSAGDRIRVKVTAKGTAAVTGSLYVWSIEV